MADPSADLREVVIRCEGAIQSLAELLPAAVAVEVAAGLMHDTFMRLEGELVACVAAIARIERDGR